MGRGERHRRKASSAQEPLLSASDVRLASEVLVLPLVSAAPVSCGVLSIANASADPSADLANEGVREHGVLGRCFLNKKRMELSVDAGTRIGLTMVDRPSQFCAPGPTKLRMRREPTVRHVDQSLPQMGKCGIGTACTAGPGPYYATAIRVFIGVSYSLIRQHFPHPRNMHRDCRDPAPWGANEPDVRRTLYLFTGSVPNKVGT